MGHNPSIDDGYTVVEPKTEGGVIVCICKVCSQVYRLEGPLKTDISPLWAHRDSHRNVPPDPFLDIDGKPYTR